ILFHKRLLTIVPLLILYLTRKLLPREAKAHVGERFLLLCCNHFCSIAQEKSRKENKGKSLVLLITSLHHLCWTWPEEDYSVFPH
ncbi:hypothetical protein Tsubulata_014207, partial [Turnera subulata]